MEHQSNNQNEGDTNNATNNDTNNEYVVDTKRPNEVASVANQNRDTTPSVKSTFGTPSFDLSHSKSLESLVHDLTFYEKLAPVYVKSSLCKHKNESDFIVAAVAGKELKLSLTQSINNIVSIQGNATLPVNLIKALLIRAGVVYEIIEDYVPLYPFYKLDKDGNVAKNKENKPTIIGYGSATEELVGGKVYISSNIADYRTTYRFRRVRKLGKEDVVVEVKASFTWSDAVQMQLSTKDNYVKQPKAMLKARAFSNGAREIAPDIMLGMYSDVEMYDSTNIDYTYDDAIDAETYVIED